MPSIKKALKNPVKTAFKLFKEHRYFAHMLAAKLVYEQRQKIPPKPHKKRLLYIVYEAPNVKLGLQLAAFGKQHDPFDVVLWCPYFLPNSFEYAKQAREVGATYLYEVNQDQNALEHSKNTESATSKFAPNFAQSVDTNDQNKINAGLTSEQKESVESSFQTLINRVNFCQAIIEQTQSDHIVLAEDNVARDSYAWQKAAQRLGLKNTVISYGVITDIEGYNAFKDNTAYHLPKNLEQNFEAHLPKWLWPLPDQHSKYMTRIPYAQALAREFMGLKVKNPWIVNTGEVDQIFVESNKYKALYVEQGLEKGKITVTGHPVCDAMAPLLLHREKEREALFTQYNFDPSKKLVVFAVPPNNTEHRASILGSYEQTIAGYIKEAQSILDCNIIMSIHPTTPPHDRTILERMNCPIDDSGVANILPLGDIYLVCVSSTIKWALACGVPIINFDCYSYNYDTYDDVGQVLDCSTLEQYRSQLQELASQKGYEEVKRLAEQEKEDWGLIDGKSLERITALLLQ